MRIGGRRAVRPASEKGTSTVREQAHSLARPALGLAVITPLVFVGAVSGAAPRFHPKAAPSVHAVITPVAAVQPTGGALSGVDMSGPVVIAIQRPTTAFHVAASTISAPPLACIDSMRPIPASRFQLTPQAGSEAAIFCSALR